MNSKRKNIYYDFGVETLGHLVTLKMRSRDMKMLVVRVYILIAMGLNIGIAGAADLEAGFMGMQWASPAVHHEELTQLYEKDNVVYYTQSRIVHMINEIPVPDVIYGFYEDRFFAVYINLESEDVFGEFRKYLKSQYGKPRRSFSMKTGETVYKWEQGKVKIKLKTNEVNYRMKLSFYYLPLSQKLNEERMEKFHDRSLQFFPIRKDKKPERIPLLRF